MKNKFTKLFLFTFFVVNLLPLASTFAGSDASEEAEIRHIREISNKALIEKDVEAFLSTLMPDYHVVTSTNLQLSGHEDQRSMMLKVFEKYPDAVYVRSPVKIKINSARATAAESGNWKGSWTDTGKQIELQGSYLAKWTRVDGQWLIQAEIFVILQ